MLRLPAILLLATTSVLLHGQSIDRLIILSDGDRNNIGKETRINTLKSDVSRFFKTSDIHHISIDTAASRNQPGKEPIENKQGKKEEKGPAFPPDQLVESQEEKFVKNIEEGLKAVKELCQEKSNSMLLAFLFEPGQGPNLQQITQSFYEHASHIKILSNETVQADLTALSCGPFTLMNYSRGMVLTKKEIEKDSAFPIIPVIIGGAAAGVGVILLTTGDGESCESVDPAWVVPGPLCNDDSPVSLVVTGTPGGTWSGIGVSSNGIFNPTAGTQPITYIVGEGTCQQSRIQEIVVTEADASWNSPSALCAGGEITLVPAGDQGGTWSGNGITDLGNGTATFSQNAAGNYSVTYIVTDGNCSSAVSHDLVVNPKADASWTVPNDVCTGLAYPLIPSGEPGGIWSGPGVTDTGGGTGVFFVTAAGVYEVSYSVGVGDCASSLSQNITAMLSPDASWAPPPNVLCVGESFVLVPSGTPGGIWSGTGVTDHGDGTGAFTSDGEGSYVVTYAVVNEPCSNSVAHTITVIPKADASWTLPINVCAQDQVTLIPGGTQGGSWSGNGITDQGNGTALFNQPEAGSYSVTYSVGQGACQDALTQSIEVHPLPDPSWSVPSGICVGQMITLTPSGTPGGTWSGSGVTDLGNGTANFTQNETGMFDVTYMVTSTPCTASLTQSIEVVNNPDPSWTLPSNVCTGQEILLVADGTSGGTWSGPGVMDHGDGTASFSQPDAGTYAVTYSVGQGNCAQSLTQDISVVSAGNPMWTPTNEVICPGQVVNLTAPEGDWTGTGVVNFGNGMGQFQGFNPGLYSVTLTVSNGSCTASESHDLEVGDFEPPVFSVPATDIEVACDGSGNQNEFQDWLDIDGGAEAVDACGGVVTITYAVNEFSDCGDAMILETTFTATDEFGNTAETTAQFIIADNEAPVFQNAPSNTTVSCDNVPPPAPVTASDVCGGAPSLEFEEIPQGNSCPYEITRTWTATDECGNTAVVEQTITATDNEPPQPTSVPNDTMIHCPGLPQQCIPPPAQVEFEDNCDSNPTVQFMEQIQQFPGGLIVTRCWNGTDDCNNTSPNYCQNITITSTSPLEEPFQPAPKVLFTISTPGEHFIDHKISKSIYPEEITWKDPGMLSGLYYETSSVQSNPYFFPLSLNIDIPLNPSLAIFIDGGITRTAIFRKYASTSGIWVLKNEVEKKFAATGVRLTLFDKRNIYFTCDVQVAHYLMSGFELTQGNLYTSSDAQIHRWMAFLNLGAYRQFGFYDIGSLDAGLNFGMNGLFVQGLFRLNLSGMMSLFQKTKR